MDECPEGVSCDLFQTSPQQPEQVCTCPSGGTMWAKMELTSEFVETITGESPVNGDRCTYAAFGTTWSLSPSDTQDIVMTMNPGGVQTVLLSGSSTLTLDTNGVSRNQACGVVMQDAFQGTPVYNEGGTPIMFPSSVPVSDYCYASQEPNSGHQESDFVDGLEWENGWSSIMQEGLGAVDAVCRCALGRVGGMLEHSGVFFTNPIFVDSMVPSILGIEASSTLVDRADEVYTAYGWRETPQYISPLIFYCREDYVLYWNLALAFDAVYNPASFRHAMWLNSHEYAMATRDRTYWIRYNLLGVDCLKEIETQTTYFNNPCGQEGNTTVPFLPNVVVGLDIGQLLWALDIKSFCGADTESDISTTCARDYLWAFASLYRRTGITSGCVPGGEIDPRICSNPTQLDGYQELYYDADYALSLPENVNAMTWPIYAKPSNNFYEFSVETAALFVRILAYSDNSSWTAANVFGIDSVWDIPTTLGTECTRDMTSGEFRVGPDAIYANVSSSCVSGISMNRRACPNSYPVYTGVSAANPKGNNIPYGYCCTGTGPSMDAALGAAFTCGSCGSCSTFGVDGSSGWKPCGATNEEVNMKICSSQGPRMSGSAVKDWRGHPYVCGNALYLGTHLFASGQEQYYCFAGPGTEGGGQLDCAQITETCGAGNSIGLNINNWVGGSYIPVYGNPRMRGMMPRVFYNNLECECLTLDTTATAHCFASIQFNDCFAYMPRPPAAGIYARGWSNVKLDYRTVFFDPMLEDYIHEVAPGTRFDTQTSAGQFDGASAILGNTSHPGGYGGIDYANNFCAQNKTPAFCQDLSETYTTMLTTTEYARYRGHGAEANSLAGILTRYYSSLVGRSSLNVGPWYDVFFYGQEYSMNTRVGDVTYSGDLPYSNSENIRYKLGSGVDLCAYVGWCLKVYTGTTVRNGTSNSPVLSLWEYIETTVSALPSFTATTDPTARDMYYSSLTQNTAGCTDVEIGDYCLVGSSAWRADPEIPFYLWNKWNGYSTPFGWGRFKSLHQQVVSQETTGISGFSTFSLPEWRLYNYPIDGTIPNDVPRPRAPWCWTSARGYVLDLQDSLMGTCITQYRCYQKFYMGDVVQSQMGCLDTPWDSDGWTAVNVVDNVVQWDTPLFNTSTTECWKNDDQRLCIITPSFTTFPPMFVNENVLSPTYTTNAANTTSTIADVAQLACGCTGTLSTILTPSWLCRNNTNGDCYVRTNSQCDAPDFNCGTQFGFEAYSDDEPSFLQLCRSCPPQNGVLTVGQCQNVYCMGILDNGSCPFGSSPCDNTYDSGIFPSAIDADVNVPSFVTAVNNMGGAVEFVWFDGIQSGYLFGKQTTSLPLLRWMVSTVSIDSMFTDGVPSVTLDETNCVGVFGPEYRFMSVEHPSYLSEGTQSNSLFPAGLTLDALQAWCAFENSECVSPWSVRRWVCIDSGQTINGPATSQCQLRQAWVDEYMQYTDVDGSNNGYYGGANERIYAPDCLSWVSGLDPDTWCQRGDAFTGCVLTKTTRHSSTLSMETVRDTFYGVVPSGWTSVGTSASSTALNCQDWCVMNANCIAWHFDGVCTGYNVTNAWEMSTGSVNDVVGTVFPITGGFFVPRVGAGPVNEMETGNIVSVYDVEGINVYVVSDDVNPITVVYENNTVSCSGTFFYYGIDATSSIVRLLNVSINSCAVITNVSAFETQSHTFPVQPLMVTVGFDTVKVVGMLSTDIESATGDGLGTATYSQGTTGDTLIGRGRGLRGVLRGSTINDMFQVTYSNTSAVYTGGVTIAEWIYTPGNNQSAVLTKDMARTHARACVPLNYRQVVTVDTLDTQTKAFNIIRRDPVDCVLAGAMEGNAEVVGEIYGPGGICSGTQELEWPSTDSTNNVATVSTLASSWWTNVLTNGAAPIFFDNSLPSPATVNSQAVVGRDVTTIPNCGINTANCILAYDVIGYVPCTGELSTVWFSCMKPTMMALYPLYAADFSVGLSTPFYYPDDLYVSPNYPTVRSLNANASWSVYDWSQYLTMIHVCDRYGYDNDPTHDDSGINGWKPGRFIACNNDPFDDTERESFCRTQQPWWVMTGLVFTQFSFSDLCPFTVGASNTQYCLVFADHPQYPSVTSFLRSALTDGLSWENTIFYYSTISLRAVGLLLFDPHVVNTLISNNIFIPGYRINGTNYLDFGPAAQVFGAPYSVLNATETLLVDNMCDASVALTPELFQALHKVMESHYNSGTDTYTFGSTASSTSSTTVLTASQVHPTFAESGALLDYDGITITGMVPGVPTRVGTSTLSVINQIATCTRYQIDGQDVTISNLILDQSLCALTGAVQQTPIVFSGAYASGSRIFNITVIDSSSAVAVLGGDSLVYTYTPIIDADGLTIFDVVFEYTSNSFIPLNQRNVLAVLGRMSGIPSVSHCFLPLPPSFTRLENCAIDAILTPGEYDCAMPNTCLTEDVGCCGRFSQHSDTIPYYDCEYGLMCVGNISEINYWYANQPNARVLCNYEETGCAMTEDCITVPENTCYYERSGCRVNASYDIEYYSVSGTTLTPTSTIQDWQYYHTELWYYVYPSYQSMRYSTKIDFVDGIGYGKYVWTIRGNVSAYDPSGFYVHALELPTVAGSVDPFDSITIVPRFAQSIDGVVSDITELTLMTDWFFATANLASFNTSLATAILSSEWCVGVEITSGTLRVTQCGNISFYTQWFFDPATARFHVLGYPHMCPTLLDDTILRWLPCKACSIGTGNAELSETLTVNKTQLFLWNTSAVLEDGLVPIEFPQVHWIIKPENTDYAYVLDSDYSCYTYTQGVPSWEPCDPNYMFPDAHYACLSNPSAFYVGILRYVCTQGYGGPIYNAILNDTSCVFQTGSIVSDNGIGGSLSRQANGSLIVVYGGAGYINGEIVTVDACVVTLYTSTVLVQPATSNFSVAAYGLEVVDYTELTNATGFLWTVPVEDAKMDVTSFYNVAGIVFTVLSGILFVMITATCYRNQELRRMAKLKTE